MSLLLLTILLLEGFITISVEILTMRQLMPFYGGSVVITSIIIGVFLLFLALGYWRGGGYRHNFLGCLSRNYLLSLLWIGVGLSYSFIACFSYLTLTQLSLPIILSLTLYLVAVLAPIVYWLGQTIPITTNLFNKNQGISKISSNALFLSTLGSFSGALMTTLFLFQTLGVAWTVVINSFLLFILIAGINRRNKRFWWKLPLLGMVLLLIKNININEEVKQFIQTNNYANYQVNTLNKQTRILRINESNSSLISKNKQGFHYVKFIRHLLFDKLKLTNKQLLIIGAGGFSITAAGTNHNQVTYVDIDPAIKKIAEAHFLNQSINGRFIGQDARQFLNQNKALYDVIISDVYSNEITIPPSLLTLEYFQQLAHHLMPGGLLIVNTIANPFFNDDYARHIDNTLRSVFNHCAFVPLNWNNHFSNNLYICPKVVTDATVYTDNLSSATFDFFSSRQHATLTPMISQQ